MQPKRVIFYKEENGKVPVKDWLYSIKDTKSRRRIFCRLHRVEQGNYGDCKGLAGCEGLLELRFDIGPGYRIYFAEDGSTVVVLLVGGGKKTQKKDIIRAAEYWNDYLENKRHEAIPNA
ncbi:MAG: type II toxin-antitoxin system RelE/ParE family toxin [Candidatus Omnitrophota bacterium]